MYCISSFIQAEHTYCICGRVVSRKMDMREIIIHTHKDIYTNNKQKQKKSNNKKCIKHTKTNTKNINKEKVLSKLNTAYYFMECLG